MYESQETSYKLIENFLNILQSYTTSKANIVELEKALKTLNEFADMLDRRVDAGVSSKTDKELINSRIKQIDSDLIVAKNQYKVSHLQLEQLLSRSIQCGISVSSVMVKDNDDIEILIKKMLDSHPSFKKIAHQIKTAQFELESTKASIMPDFKLRAEHQRGSLYENSSNSSQNLIYAAFSVTTHAGLSAFSNIEAAKVKVHQIGFQKQTLEKELTDGVLTDYNKYLVATNKIDTLKSSIISSQNVLDSYTRLFVAGKKQWLDLVNASKELMQYNVDLSNQIALKQVLEYKIALKTGRINLQNGKIDDI
jgi:adhesin transport system outer membrane protein